MGPIFASTLRTGACKARMARGLYAVLWAAAAACPGTAAAQQGQAQAQAVMIGPASVVNSAAMDFGRIGTIGVGGTVTIEPQANTCTYTGDLIRVGGNCHAAAFEVMGRRNWIIRVRNQSGSVITLTGPGGATMQVTGLTIGTTDLVIAPGGGSPSGQLGRYRITSTSGAAQFRIGGTLVVGALQAPGVYTGTVQVQVLYN